MPELCEEDPLTAMGEGARRMKVWILSWEDLCCDQNGIIGVWHFEADARATGLALAKKEPNIAHHGWDVKWNGSHMVFRGGWNGTWLEYRAISLVEHKVYLVEQEMR